MVTFRTALAAVAGLAALTVDAPYAETIREQDVSYVRDVLTDRPLVFAAGAMQFFRSV